MHSGTQINYNGRVFRTISNFSTGDAGSGTWFCYHEKDGFVWGEYCGGGILKGMLLAKKADDGSLDMRYLHLNSCGELKTGICSSVVEVLPNGRYRLFEKWRWTSGDCSAGESVIEEISGALIPARRRVPNKGFSILGLC
jgi:hypothetical protein